MKEFEKLLRRLPTNWHFEFYLDGIDSEGKGIYVVKLLARDRKVFGTITSDLNACLSSLGKELNSLIIEVTVGNHAHSEQEQD